MRAEAACFSAGLEIGVGVLLKSAVESGLPSGQTDSTDEVASERASFMPRRERRSENVQGDKEEARAFLG